MAEGFGRALLGDRFLVHSAGIEKHGLNPRAVAVMAEAGVDISGHCSKTLDELLAELGGASPDLVVTVCGDADRRCPAFPGNTRALHVGFDDPPGLTRNAKGDEDALPVYRRVRDEIAEFIRTLPEHMAWNETSPRA